jgi:hypothetical protein
VGCTLPGFLYAFKLAAEKNIPLLIHGRTRAQMLKGLSPGTSDPFIPMLAGNLRPYDTLAARRVIVTMAEKLVKAIKIFAPQPSLRHQIEGLFIPDLVKLRNMPVPPDIVGYFLYEPY